MGYAYYTRMIDGVERHLGYGVQCLCDHPKCNEVIDRGLAYLCGQYPGEHHPVGCGRYFCPEHKRGWRRSEDRDTYIEVCGRCAQSRPPWPMKPDLPDALEDIAFDNPPLNTGLGFGIEQREPNP